MKGLAERFFAALEKQKKEYKFVFMDKAGEIRLVRCRYRLYRGRKFLGWYWDYSDGIFGKHINEKRTKKWQYMGKL